MTQMQKGSGFRRSVLIGVRLWLKFFIRLRPSVFAKASASNSSTSSGLPDSQQSTLNHLLFRDADVLWLGKEAERFVAAFAADSTLLHAAEQDTQVTP